jgi:hypothetical protein
VRRPIAQGLQFVALYDINDALRIWGVMAAHMIVRATVPNAGDRKPFDRWYAEIHMPQAVAAFRPSRSWRSWSTIDPAVHYAFYEYDGTARVEEVMGTVEFKTMVADFSKAWDGKVSRERDVVVTVQMLVE